MHVILKSTYEMPKSMKILMDLINRFFNVFYNPWKKTCSGPSHSIKNKIKKFLKYNLG